VIPALQGKAHLQRLLGKILGIRRVEQLGTGEQKVPQGVEVCRRGLCFPCRWDVRQRDVDVTAATPSSEQFAGRGDLGDIRRTVPALHQMGGQPLLFVFGGQPEIAAVSHNVDAAHISHEYPPFGFARPHDDKAD